MVMKANQADEKVYIILETWSGFGARGLLREKEQKLLEFFLDVYKEVFVMDYLGSRG
jgi:hypothetical protein